MAFLDFKEYNQVTMFPTTRLPMDTPLASAYVPYQMWEEPISPEDALEKGTIFTELDFPFLCDGGANFER